MENVEISILICTRNRPHTLPIALKSICKQTITIPIEVLILDDSFMDIQLQNDKIIKACDIPKNMEIQHVPFTCMHNTIYDKLQAGVILTSGDIIIQADDDDYNTPDRIKILYEHLQSGADFCHYSKPYWAYLGKNEIYQLVVNNHPLKIIQGSTFAYKKKAFELIGGYKGCVTNVHDKFLATKIMKSNLIVHDCATTNSLMQIAFEHGENYWSKSRDLTTNLYTKTCLQVSNYIK